MTKKKKKKTKVNISTATPDDIRQAILDNYFDGEKPSDFKQRHAIKFLCNIAVFNLDTLKSNGQK
jgi:hypothetical protein